MDTEAGKSIAAVLAVVIAVSLALTQVLGGLLVYLTEAVKATGKVKPGYSGLVTIVLGVLMGMVLSGLAHNMTPGDAYSLGTMLLLGAFAGAMMAGGAVKTYKAMGEVNQDAKGAEATLAAFGVASEADEIDEAVNLYKDLQEQYSLTMAHVSKDFGPQPEGAPESEPAPPLETVTTAGT